MQTQFQEKMTDEIVNRHSPVYDLVYFIGRRGAVTPVLDLIEEKFQEKHPEKVIKRLTAGNFLDETIAITGYAIRPMPECDVYIFENIGDLAGMEYNEQRLYGVLDHLLESGRQIIVTGELPVSEFLPLAPRICAQIEGGISCRIE